MRTGGNTCGRRHQGHWPGHDKEVQRGHSRVQDSIPVRPPWCVREARVLQGHVGTLEWDHSLRGVLRDRRWPFFCSGEPPRRPREDFVREHWRRGAGEADAGQTDACRGSAEGFGQEVLAVWEALAAATEYGPAYRAGPDQAAQRDTVHLVQAALVHDDHDEDGLAACLLDVGYGTLDGGPGAEDIIYHDYLLPASDRGEVRA